MSQFPAIYKDAWIESSGRKMLNSYFLRYASFVLHRETDFVWQPNLSRNWPWWHPRGYSFGRICCEWNKQGRFLCLLDGTVSKTVVGPIYLFQISVLSVYQCHLHFVFTIIIAFTAFECREFSFSFEVTYTFRCNLTSS